jgi:hypothetical protein
MNRKLNISAPKPFVALTESRKSSDWCTIVNDVRTFFITDPDFVIPLLPEPDMEMRLAA